VKQGTSLMLASPDRIKCSIQGLLFLPPLRSHLCLAFLDFQDTPFLGLDMVVHACNSSYLEGRVGESQSAAGPGKVTARPCLENKLKARGLGVWLECSD
jgi:hypothetical protein